ncbi:MAG: ribosome small subunit-dependent GTPase A [Pseudohongiellaceae bacterium]|nr:ribosome small subunit-dependent GTPase A [Pseudohongiellaceae bacterium]
MNELLVKLGFVPFFAQQLSDYSVQESRLGRVISVQRSVIGVACGDERRSVELSINLQQAEPIDRPTVGDWVILDETLTRIEQVLERKSLFKRIGSGNTTQFQPIAANIDVLFIVTSCNEEFKESRLERYLALCNEAGAIPVIILTKIDLADDVNSFIERARSVQSGVAVEGVNALDLSTLDGVKGWIAGNATIALVGSSGVGKSTLLNALAQDTLAATGGIREDDKKGRHTTTHRELYFLPSGGLIIDVPGMRELRIADVDDGLGHVFGDIEQLSSQCRFMDCQHMNEPGCAVLASIEEGHLNKRRLDSYHKLMRENKLSTASMAEKRAKDRSFGKMVKGAKIHKEKTGRRDVP